MQEGALEIKRTDGNSANFRYRVANPTIIQQWLFMLNGTNGKLEFRNATARREPFTLNASADQQYLRGRGRGRNRNEQPRRNAGRQRLDLPTWWPDSCRLRFRAGL